MKKRIWIGTMSLFLPVFLFAQSANEQLQKANDLYKQLKESEALNAYKSVLSVDSDNMTALVKCTELCSSLGKKQSDKNNRNNYYTEAKQYADKALANNPDSADAYYLQALSYANLSQTEDENKKIVEDVKLIKSNADKGLAINPAHTRLNYMAGKWHLEMINLNWFKKAALKTLYGNGLQKPDIDSAIFFMGKCKSLEPYFVQNYLDLAKAYEAKKRPTDEIEILNQMVKLPNRTADDATLKNEGKKMLQALE
ncbi:MAG: hypothetical protein M3R72_10080 [Bacteroidota bacterium]|nr:hypothetical protein [Bacteroidota bacterium]